MSISNIERMVEAIVRDRMNYMLSMTPEEQDTFIANMIREQLESYSNDYIQELYQDLGD